MGALSFSPSPITTTPVIGTEPSTWRMASTAAWSTASLSPKPILRAPAMAAASVTRTSSRARLRSGASPRARASIQHLQVVVGPGLATGPFFSTEGTGIQGRGGLPLTMVAPPARVCAASGSRALAPPIPPGWRQGPAARPAPAVPLAFGGSGGREPRPRARPPAQPRPGAAGRLRGRRGRGAQGGQALGRRPPDRGHTFGFARAEDVAGVLVVLAIAASAVVAASESLVKLAGDVPPLRNPGWALAAAFAGVVGNEAVAQYKLRVGRRINS